MVTTNQVLARKSLRQFERHLTISIWTRHLTFQSLIQTMIKEIATLMLLRSFILDMVLNLEDQIATGLQRVIESGVTAGSCTIIDGLQKMAKSE